MKKQQTSPSCFVLLLIYIFSLLVSIIYNYNYLLSEKSARSDLILHAVLMWYSINNLVCALFKILIAFGGLLVWA